MKVSVFVMTSWLLLCASACLPVAPGGDGRCGEGEECPADVGGDTCDDTSNCATVECDADEDCGDGEVCDASACVPRTPDTCDDTSNCIPPCEVDGDCADAEVCVDGGCFFEEVDEVALCASYCENLYGSCVKNTCEGLNEADTANLDEQYALCLNGGTAQDGSVINPCAQDYLADPQFAAQVDQFAAEACGSSTALEGVYCGSFGFGEKCDCVGCIIEESPECDCEGGTLNAICIPAIDPDTGEDTSYCVSGPCDAGSTQAGAIAVGETTGCGEDGMCINENTQNGVSSICYDLCSVNADCRDGYACEVLGFFMSGDAMGKCTPACETNEDCPAYTLTADPNTQLNSFCNTDEWCEIPCDPDEAGSCGTGGELACTVKAGLNETNDFKGSCSIAGE